MKSNDKVQDYPRETFVHIPFEDVELDHVPYTAQFQYSVTENFARPTIWTPTVPMDGKQTFLLNGPGLGVGRYKVWAKFQEGEDAPVLLAGEFTLS